MADFCKQCSIYMFGEDYRDLAGIESVDGPDYPVSMICEGCGYTLVDIEGACVWDKCLVNHVKGYRRNNYVLKIQGVADDVSEDDIPF